MKTLKIKSDLIKKIQLLPVVIRRIIATLVIFILFGGVVMTYSYLRDVLLPDNSREVKGDTEEVKLAKEILNQTESAEPFDLVYRVIEYEELPVYPEVWVENKFGKNASIEISGANQDPDNDGLSNKLEYLYSANPLDPDTLCGGRIDGDMCIGRNDLENVNEGISPLTGEPLTIPESFSIQKQDYNVLSQIEDSFNRALREGADFPTLYQLSRDVDLSSELDKIEITLIDENIRNITEYNEFRIEIIELFLEADELSGLSRIYNLSTREQIEQEINIYTDITTRTKNTKVPIRFEKTHKLFILLFEKIVDLVEHRQQIISDKTGNITDEYKETSKKKAVDIVWIYRYLSDEMKKDQQTLQQTLED